jgi:hypothetical protein
MMSIHLRDDGEEAGKGRVEATQPFIFSADETTDIGYDAGTAVSTKAPTGKFTGTINWVKLDLGDDTHDHLVDPEQAMRVAMSTQ